MKSTKLYLKKHSNKIKDILKYYGYHSINITDKEIRCAKKTSDNPSTVRIKLNDNLSSCDFSTSYNGDLFGLIATHTNLKYGEVIKTVKIMLTAKVEGSFKSEENTLFDGFFDNLYTSYEQQEENDEVIYDISILDQYSKYKWNLRFLKDGILPSSQYKFRIGYDKYSNRITVPWVNEDGELIGCMGRIDDDIPTNYKYIPLVAFPKHKFLYGLYQNKEYIKESKEVYLFEAEKSVMQCDSFKVNNTVGLGGNSISKIQVEMLLRLGVERFIVSLDEGIDIEIIKKNIKTIKDCCFMRDDVKIGVILDKENKYMKKGSKCSPVDQGKEIFEKLKNECMIGG